MRVNNRIHPVDCTCRACSSPAGKGRRTAALQGTVRALFLIAAICSIPFVVAWAIASASGDRR